MTTPAPDHFPRESPHHSARSSSPLSLPPSSPSRPNLNPIMAHSEPEPNPQPSVPLPQEPNPSKTASVTIIKPTITTNLPKKPTLKPTKKPVAKNPTYSEIASLYQFTWDRIDDLKIITGALCERLIGLEDTVATLDEGDTMEAFMRKAYDMATEGQLIAMIAEQFKETGMKIAEMGTDVGLDGFDEDKNGEGNKKRDGDVDEDWVRNVIQNENRNGCGNTANVVNGNEKKKRDGSKIDDNGKRDDCGKAKLHEHGWNSRVGSMIINLVDTESDPDL